MAKKYFSMIAPTRIAISFIKLSRSIEFEKTLSVNSPIKYGGKIPTMSLNNRNKSPIKRFFL